MAPFLWLLISSYTYLAVVACSLSLKQVKILSPRNSRIERKYQPLTCMLQLVSRKIISHLSAKCCRILVAEDIEWACLHEISCKPCWTARLAVWIKYICYIYSLFSLCFQCSKIIWSFTYVATESFSDSSSILLYLLFVAGFPAWTSLVCTQQGYTCQTFTPSCRIQVFPLWLSETYQQF
jgi:hypothetical protein